MSSAFEGLPKTPYLKLNKPIYKKTTNYGHFGKQELELEKIIEM